MFINKNNSSRFMSTIGKYHAEHSSGSGIDPEKLGKVADYFLQGYLKIAGVTDPDATAIIRNGIPTLGYRRGSDKTTETGLFSYKLPSGITAEINRKSQDLGPHDSELVDAIDRANNGETIEGPIAECLKEHYERANVAQPLSAYMEELRAKWPYPY